MSECVVCGGADFDLQGGLYFCSECGTQSQNAREELTETQEVATGALRALRLKAQPETNRKRRTWGKVLGTGEEDEESGEVVNLHQLEKFQMVLKKQAEALVQLGFDPSVKEAMRLIWFTYLKHYGYAFSSADSSGMQPDRDGDATSCVATAAESSHEGTSEAGKKGSRATAGKRKKGQAQKQTASAGRSFDTFPDDEHLFESDTESDLENDQDTAEGDMGGEGGVLAWKRMRSQLRRNVHPANFVLRHTLGIVYLALLYTGHYVFPVDILRWITDNSIPYYNIGLIIPRPLCSVQDAITIGKDSKANLVPYLPFLVKPGDEATAKPPLCTSDGIHCSASQLYANVPLPPLPSFSARTVCRTLVDRLMLPESIRRMVDRAVVGVYSPHFMDCFSRFQTALGRRKKQKRFDCECLGVVIMVLRLVYRLDDRFEMHQSLVSGSTDQSALTPANAVYAWMDWVRLYLEHLQESQANCIPINDSEFERVRDYQKYLAFCKDGIFALRPAPYKGEHCFKNYNREWSLCVSEIFAAHRRRVQNRACTEQQEQEEEQLQDRRQSKVEQSRGETKHTHWTFTPRLVPLDFTVNGLFAWDNYECLPVTRTTEHLQDVSLSLSMAFLLQICCELIDVDLEEMYWALHVVQGAFKEGTLVAIEKLLVALPKE